MKLNSDQWQLHCTTIEEKQELFDYAISKRVPISEYPDGDYRDDSALKIGWWPSDGLGGRGLMSFNEEEPVESITPDDFRQMCDEYRHR